MKFEFDQIKNNILMAERGISFQQVFEVIAEKGILANIPHPNQKKYPNQFMFIVEFKNYIYCVPYVLNGNSIFLKTIFPNRDYLYLLKENNNEKD